MNSVAALFAPLLLLISAAVEAPRAAQPAADEAGVPSGPVSRPGRAGSDLWADMARAYRPDLAEQVRIEQQLTIRIGPRPAPMPLSPAMFDEDFAAGGAHFVERKFGKCLPISGLWGVQPAPGNRLLLIMRDQRLVTASLKKGCNSRDFYSGFIVARNGDGMICTGRDQLLSRSGANCQVNSFRQLIQADD